MTEGHGKGDLMERSGKSCSAMERPSSCQLFENKLFDELMAVVSPRATGTMAQCGTSYLAVLSLTSLCSTAGLGGRRPPWQTALPHRAGREGKLGGRRTPMRVLSLQGLQGQEEALGLLSRFGEQQVPPSPCEPSEKRQTGHPINLCSAAPVHQRLGKPSQRHSTHALQVTG